MFPKSYSIVLEDSPVSVSGKRQTLSTESFIPKMQSFLGFEVIGYFWKENYVPGEQYS